VWKYVTTKFNYLIQLVDSIGNKHILAMNELIKYAFGYKYNYSVFTLIK